MDFVRLGLKHTAECICEILKECGFNNCTDSSGYFIIRQFIDKADRCVDVYKSDIDITPHYVVYCSYENESFDYKYTKDLSEESLLEVLKEFYDTEI